LAQLDQEANGIDSSEKVAPSASEGQGEQALRTMAVLPEVALHLESLQDQLASIGLDDLEGQNEDLP
jgi:hypothetical protein